MAKGHRIDAEGPIERTTDLAVALWREAMVCAGKTYLIDARVDVVSRTPPAASTPRGVRSNPKVQQGEAP
jgi:hypothetical protein